jgi:hypothetical protein
MGLSNKLIRQLPAKKDYSTLEDFIVSLVRFLIFAISWALVAGRRCLSLAGSYWMGRNMLWSLLDGVSASFFAAPFFEEEDGEFSDGQI